MYIFFKIKSAPYNSLNNLTNDQILLFIYRFVINYVYTNLDMYIILFSLYPLKSHNTVYTE